MKIPPARASIEGVVVSRSCNVLICVRGEDGETICFRVTPELGAKLDLGQPAVVELDARGRAQVARAVSARA